MTELARRAARVARALGSAHVAALAEAYRPASGHTPAAAAVAAQAVPAPHRDDIDALNQAWSTAPDTPGAAIALALETAEAARSVDDSPQVEVVVTGPDSPDAPVRLTSEVVRQLIDQATRRVMLVSYAAYQLPSVIAALEAAKTRGVRVSLILESPEKLDGGGGAYAYAAFETYHWPLDQRIPPEAKLHAKAVLVDGKAALLTSANMTGAAYDKNIELGVLCRGGGTAHQIQRHFDALIARGVLVRVGKEHAL